MAIIVNGTDMKEAVIKTEQFEMRVLDLTPDFLKVNVTGISRDAFNFVPRFITIVYPEKTVSARDAGPIAIRPKESAQVSISFREKLRIEKFLPFDLRYTNKRLATISIE